MKIKKLNISGYGKFSNKEIELKDGFNLVYGNNESGKSTIQSYIKNMIFGFANKNKDSEGRLPENKKYNPWSSEAYGGTINVVTDDGNEYIVEKDFSKKTTKVFNKNLEELTSQFDFNKKEGVLFGESIFKMDRGTFENTAFIKQSETKVFKKEKNAIFDKIINLQDTGDEELSVSRAIEALKKGSLVLGHKTTKNRLFNTTQEKLRVLQNKYDEALRERNKIISEQEREKHLSQEIVTLNEKILKIKEKIKLKEKFSKFNEIVKQKKPFKNQTK